LARRFTTWLVIWIALLGTAMPVLACAAGDWGDGCCPATTNAPCAGGSSEVAWQTTVASCCSAAPTSAQGVSVRPGRDANASVQPSGSPEPFVAASWPTVGSGVATAPLTPRFAIPPHRADAALTYLRTGRLRL
jgi:hypothetical protein